MPACSRRSSSGVSACAHRLSRRPSQKNHGPHATPASGMVRRLVTPTPRPRGRSSWNCRSIRWQVPQATTPSMLMRWSKNSVAPKAAAAGSSACLLVGSAGSGGSDASDMEAIVAFSASLKLSPLQAVRSNADTAAHSHPDRRPAMARHSTRLNVTVSAPAAAEMSKRSSHQPLIENFMPSMR